MGSWTLDDVAQMVQELCKQMADLQKGLEDLRKDMKEIANRHLKLLDELNDAYHELAEGETFLGEITPDDEGDST